MLFFFYILIQNSLKTQKNQQQVLIEQNHQLLQHLMESVPYSITPEKYNSNVMIDNEIDLVLQDIQKMLGCSRAFLVTFHNGRKRFIRIVFLKDEYTQ